LLASSLLIPPALCANWFDRYDHRNYIGNTPHMIRRVADDCRRNARRLMEVAKVAVHVMQLEPDSIHWLSAASERI